MIVVVDYCKGNLKSVERGLQAVGAEVVVSADPGVIASADAIVLPGVGSFADASATMNELGQMQVMRDMIVSGVPFLGICLGLHLMFEWGIEGATDSNNERFGANEKAIPGQMAATAYNTTFATKGLGIISGTVGRVLDVDAEGNTYKIPHVGWNSISFDEAAQYPLFHGIPSGEYFYFTHSYCPPETKEAIAFTQHASLFPSAIAYKDTAFGVQFHPEKSSDAGAVVLKNFLNLTKGK